MSRSYSPSIEDEEVAFLREHLKDEDGSTDQRALSAALSAKLGRRNCRDKLALPRLRSGLIILCSVFIIFSFLLALRSTVLLKEFRPAQREEAVTSQQSPFSGAFSRVKSRSNLEEKYQRITLVAVWNNDGQSQFLRHFLYTAQLNNDTIDVLFVNRRMKEEDKCIDFDSRGIDTKFGGNVKVVCLSPDEWRERRTNFLCSEEFGWNCDAEQSLAVKDTFEHYTDRINCNLIPLHGHIYRDLFLHPEQPLWAWFDVDMFLGNMAHFPTNILAALSVISGTHKSPDQVFMAGQWTAFNMDDRETGVGWKKMKEFSSVRAWLRREFDPETTGEKYWSGAYLRAHPDLPGQNMSWAMLPDMQGDDRYEMSEKEKYVISGRDILLVDPTFSRKDIEAVLELERQHGPIHDELGGVGWTPGMDGSEYLVQNASMTSSEAMALAQKQAGNHFKPFDGIVESVKLQEGDECGNFGMWWVEADTRQCVDDHPYTNIRPSLLRASLVRFKEQEPGYVVRRLERDHRHRGYIRKFLRHHLDIKFYWWFKLPPFEITPDKVLLYNSEKIEVFEMGENRDKNLYYADGNP